jgi:hypothetical protein
MSMNDQLDSVKMFGVSSDRVDVEGFLVRAMTAADENAIVVEPRRRHTDLPTNNMLVRGCIAMGCQVASAQETSLLQLKLASQINSSM